MMESKYISRVLSHIKNKSRCAAINRELSDHLDEKGKEYLALGYEEDGALAIAETAMGDADVVGEQFDAITKNRTRKTAWSCAFSVTSFFLTIAVCALLYWLNRTRTPYNWTVMNNLSAHRSQFYFAMILCCVFVLNLISMLLGAARHRSVNAVFGFLGAEALIMTTGTLHNMDAYDFISQIRHFDLTAVFYAVNEGRFNIKEQAISNICLGLLFLVLILLILAFNIRTAHLKNTRRDLSLKKMLTVFLSGLTVVTLLAGIGSVSEVYLSRNRIIRDTQTALTSLEKRFLNEAETFETLNIEAINNGDFDVFQGYKVYDIVQPAAMSAGRQGHDIDAYAESGVNPYIQITMSTETVNDKWYTETAFQAYIRNPFDILSDEMFFNVYSKADLSGIHYGADISEAPMPAKMIYYSPDITVAEEQPDAQCFVKLVYDLYENEYLVYTRDEESGRFLLTENTEIPYEQTDTLTIEQRLAFTDAVNADFSNRLYGDWQECELCYYYPLGIYYNADGDRYLIEIIADFELKEKSSSQNPGNFVLSVGARFEDGKCGILSMHSAPLVKNISNIPDAEPEDNYKYFSDHAEHIETFLDERSYKKFVSMGDEPINRIIAFHSQYNAYQQAMEEFQDIPIPQTTEDVIALAQEWAPNDWRTEEDLELLRTKPSFSFSANDSYDLMVGTGYGIGKSKWLKYNFQTQTEFLLTPDDWQYIKDIPLGLTEEEFYRCCGVYAPYEYCETEDGTKIMTLYFHDGEMWSKYYYTFENGILTDISPSEEFAAKHQ